MPIKKDAATRSEGAVLAHRVLMRTAEVFRDQAISEPKGSTYAALASAVFTWLAFEAYLNHVIEHSHPKVFKKEQEFFILAETATLAYWKVPPDYDEALCVSSETNGAATAMLSSSCTESETGWFRRKSTRYSSVTVHSLDDDRPFMQSEWIDAEVTPGRMLVLPRYD